MDAIIPQLARKETQLGGREFFASIRFGGMVRSVGRECILRRMMERKTG